MPTGKSGARSRPRSNGRMRATSSPIRTTSTRSSRSCAPVWSTMRCRPRPPRLPRSRVTVASEHDPEKRIAVFGKDHAQDRIASVPEATRELSEFAPAKVNLTLHVLGRRTDGYHEIESLVVFADVGDRLPLAPGDALTLDVSGPTAQA